MEDYIELYPGNWLYNAGVVGLLRVLSNIENSSDDFDLKEDGGVAIRRDLLDKAFQDKKIFQNQKTKQVPLWHYWYLVETWSKYADKNPDSSDLENLDKFKSNIYKPAVAKLFAQHGVYQNYYPPNKINEKQGQHSGLDYFVQYIGLTSGKRVVLKHSNSSNGSKCDFCLSTEYETHTIDRMFTKELMPSIKMPNSYWNCLQEGLDKICSLCQFIIIHHHLVFTKIYDGSEIFINAPSFKLMYELNKLVKEIYSSKGKSKSVRKILGMTLIQYAGKLWSNLGKWSQMNVEVVIRKGNAIDFYSLPYHTVNILSDREIAKLIGSIDESKILDYIISGKYEEILRSVYREMR
ncbi:MAG: hypothetical protein NZ526_02310, partial [Aquificaceae bacterium]|nr:hypothetical protein [Aquificaceae bacterium]